MHRIGIVPAAGKAERWGGTLKELMPLSMGRTILDHTLDVMTSTVDQIVIVTSQEKIQTISAHVGDRTRTPISFTLQHAAHGPDIMGAIVAGCETKADRYFFAMPDTHYDRDAFQYFPTHDFAMGLFDTTTPERFGVLAGREIVNKRAQWQLNKDGKLHTYNAWGVLTWTSDCVALWRDLKPESYTIAINQAIDEYGVNFWRLKQYYDFASHDDYLRFFFDGHSSEHLKQMFCDAPGETQ